MFDYETAYTELASTEKDLRKSDLENQLLVSINLNYLEEAQKIAYSGVEKIGWENGFYRTDIGNRGL